MGQEGTPLGVRAGPVGADPQGVRRAPRTDG